MSLGIRLNKIFEYKKTNANKFAKLIGSERGDNFTNIINGRTYDPKSKLLIDVITAFPDINARWFLTGEGEMITKPKKTYNKKASRIKSVLEPRETLKYDTPEENIELLRTDINTLIDIYMGHKK